MNEQLPSASSAQAPAREGLQAPQPRIYVASLADHNSGDLLGRWLQADQEPAVLRAQVDAMLGASSHEVAEDWAIHDYEHFEGIRIDEFDSLGRVARLAAGLRRHGSAFAAFARWYDEDEAASCRSFEAHYAGHWASLGEYAEHLLAETDLEAALDAVVPDPYRAYVRIDAEGYGRDLALNGDITAMKADEGGVYVFSPIGRDVVDSTGHK